MRGMPAPTHADRRTKLGATQLAIPRKGDLEHRKVSSGALPESRARSWAGATYVWRCRVKLPASITSASNGN